MCGFIGCIHAKPHQMDADREHQFKEMNDIITHRGPDDEGFYFDEYIQFGFRRLSIIDLESGHQPLSYENKRYWIIFNGEIYNHIELRRELIEKGYSFSTHSDTEVIIALYSHYKEKAVQKLRGMFAFVIWDKLEQTLFGARDHFGIKPFFYYEKEDVTYFASEKKSILLAEDHVLNVESLQHYLSFQYVPEPETMTKHIKKLPPGHYFTQKQGGKLTIKRYFEAKFSADQNLRI